MDTVSLHSCGVYEVDWIVIDIVIRVSTKILINIRQGVNGKEPPYVRIIEPRPPVVQPVLQVPLVVGRLEAFPYINVPPQLAAKRVMVIGHAPVGSGTFRFVLKGRHWAQPQRQPRSLVFVL